MSPHALVSSSPAGLPSLPVAHSSLVGSSCCRGLRCCSGAFSFFSFFSSFLAGAAAGFWKGRWGWEGPRGFGQRAVRALVARSTRRVADWKKYVIKYGRRRERVRQFPTVGAGAAAAAACCAF